MSISEFIQKKLATLPKIFVNSQTAVDRIDRLNSQISKVEMEVNGENFDASKVSKFHNPFKKSPVVYQSVACDGRMIFAIEISN